jgi:hypothetical protein
MKMAKSQYAHLQWVGSYVEKIGRENLPITELIDSIREICR